MMILSAALLLIAVPNGQGAQLGRRAKPLRPLNEIITTADYPVDAIIRNAEGMTRFELAIDASGAPYGCRILKTTKEPSLDRVTCDVLMARAKFEPALDAKGRPVADTFASAINWRLPNKATAVLSYGPSRRVLRVFSAAAGVNHCELTVDNYAWPRLTRDQCLSIAGREVIDFAEQRKMTAPITMIDTFSPHPSQAGEPEHKYGVVATEMTVAIRIGAGGKVTYCQPISSKLLPDLPMQGKRQPNLCEDMKILEWMFTPADDHTVVRKGQFTSRVYLGEGSAEAKLLKAR